MTTALAAAIRRPRSRILRLLLKPGNVLPALVWMFLVVNQAVNSGFPPSPSTGGLLLINTTAMVLFVVRRDATKVGSPLDGAIALAGTFIVSALHDAGQLKDAELLPTAVQAVGVAGWAVSLSYLGRSFGIVAADRGLVARGPYAVVRHPIYAFEALFFVGYMIAVPEPRTFLIIGAWAALQVLRILREEAIIEGYSEYKTRVRWRILPFVW
jgi:hypothetical protein